MLDRKLFLRPTAHRGLHDSAAGLVENTGPAFEAAIDAGYGIECDVRSAADGLPVVFHDKMLDRLVEGRGGPIADVAVSDLGRLKHRSGGTRILTLAELLDLVGERVPVLADIKSEWRPPDLPHLTEIARLAIAYKGPLALMSFDPAVLSVLRSLVPGVPRGIVSGGYRFPNGARWWRHEIGTVRAWRLRHLLESRSARPSFVAYDVKAMPALATSASRTLFGLPVFTWTVRCENDRRIAARFADAPIFEGYKA
jgi:glycerophosphoryl diester phosphodiesterase